MGKVEPGASRQRKRLEIQDSLQRQEDTKATLGLSVSETPCTLKTSHSFVPSEHQGLMQPACPLYPSAKARVHGHQRASLFISFKVVPQALKMLVAERPRAAPKEGILFRHQPSALAKSEETTGGALIPSTLHLGFRNRSPDPCTKKRGQSFLRRGGWWEGSAPALQGCSHPEDRNHGD